MKSDMLYLYGDDGRPVRFVRSPHKISGKLTAPKFVIFHFTGAQTASSAINWFTNEESNVSAHLVIDRDGSITQLVAFDDVAFHAGKSRYGDIVGLNHHSIGIELVNAGKLVPKLQDNLFFDAFGHPVAINEVRAINGESWHDYSEEQIKAAVGAFTALLEAFGPLKPLGHSEIAQGRKIDPGPCFPWDRFR